MANESDKVALVTGANRGIGYAIVEELLIRGVKTVYLTARNIKKGKDAVAILELEGLHPKFHQLDVTDELSVKNCAKYIKDNHGGLDLLINNAAVMTEFVRSTTYEDSVKVLNTNYYGVLTVEKYFFPILRENARVLNISSDCGHISNLKNKEWIARLTREDITRADVDAFVEWFLFSVKYSRWRICDFREIVLLAYRVSKIALCALTRAQQRRIDRNISINSIHPGLVQTGMTNWRGFYTTKESSKVPVYVALDVDQSVKGRYFWFDKTEKGWEDPSWPLYCDFN